MKDQSRKLSSRTLRARTAVHIKWYNESFQTTNSLFPIRPKTRKSISSRQDRFPNFPGCVPVAQCSRWKGKRLVAVSADGCSSQCASSFIIQCNLSSKRKEPTDKTKNK